MQYAPMIETVQHQLQVTRGAAESVLAATVQALAETSRGNEMHDLQVQLPEPLASITPAGQDTERSVEEFGARVADLSALSGPIEARRGVETVMLVLRQAVTGGQLSQLMDALPSEYAQLLPTALGLNPAAELFADRVRVRAELPDLERAVSVTRAVLAVLGQRVHHGQARDLLFALPAELRPDLPAADPEQPDFDLQEFLTKITRETRSSNTARARDYTQAVLATAFERAPDEADQTRDQLPRDLARLIDQQHNHEGTERFPQ